MGSEMCIRDSYNTYYNGSLAFTDGMVEKENGNKDNFTEIIPLDAVGNKNSRNLGSSNFDRAIEKSEKAIKLHSIKRRPEWTKNRRKTAKDIENLLGEKKEAQESYSHQAGGNNSVTESLQKEKVLKARDIAGQAAGHFIGKIAGGKPPFFSVQMDMCRFEEKEIPRFSLPVKLGNGKEEMELEILEEIIQQNYIKIIEDVNAILKKIEDKLKEKSAVPPTGTHKTEQKIIR